MSDSATHLQVVEPPESSGGGLVDALRRRLDGTYSLDAWGMDDDVTRLAGRVARLRWSAEVEGLEHLPVDGPALLVANRRLGWSEPVVVASSLLGRTGRVVRPVGGSEFDPLRGLLRRLGALPARPVEVAAALRAGNLVLVPTRREPVRNRPGHLPIELLATAVATDVPLVPVAVFGWEFGRRWRVRIGAPVEVERPVGAGRSSSAKAVRWDPADEARLVGAAAVEVATALDAMLAELAERDLGHRILSVVPRIGGDATDAGVPGEWEGT